MVKKKDEVYIEIVEKRRIRRSTLQSRVTRKQNILSELYGRREILQTQISTVESDLLALRELLQKYPVKEEVKKDGKEGSK